MSFKNPVVGGNNALVRDAIQSEGFVSGSTGWRIERDGDAEFNDITARGSVVLDGASTLLVYDDDGNIIAAISPEGGTDPESGQTYQKGIDSYDTELGARTYQINIRDGVIIFNFLQTNLFRQRGLIQANQPLNASQAPSLGMYAPSDNTDQRQAAVVCFGTSSNGTDEHRVSITGLDPLDDNALIPTTVDVNGDLNVSGGLAVEGSVWTDYTPTWTASVSNPTIGNGTLTGAYTRIGDMVTFYAYLQVGSTSTIGSGAYGLSLPVPQHGTARQSLTGWVVDASSGSGGRYPASVLVSPSIVRILVEENTFGISSSSPFTWATGDELCISGTYRAAT